MAYFLVVGSGDLPASDAEIVFGNSLHRECLRHSTTAFTSTRDWFRLGIKFRLFRCSYLSVFIVSASLSTRTARRCSLYRSEVLMIQLFSLKNAVPNW